MRDTTLRTALEDELFANPDDLATHAAYADLLSEQGNPLGDYIQMQLALEDHSLSPRQRDELITQEQHLWLRHRENWLGPLASYLLDSDNVSFSFRRGWLDSLEIGNLSVPFARALRDCRQAGLLRHLSLLDGSDEDTTAEPDDNVPENDYHKGFWPLVGADCLRNVRIFRMGEDQGDDYEEYTCYLYTSAPPALVRGMPRLEELYLFAKSYHLTDILTLPTLKNLRILKAYHTTRVIRLDMLAANPAFAHLTHLMLHPHHLAWGYDHPTQEEDEAAGFREEEGYIPLRVVEALVNSPHLSHLTHLQLRCSSMGDEGCQAIVKSGILKRLKSLDVRHGRITDSGASILAECPDVRHLAWLDLGANALSRDGEGIIKALRIGCNLQDQHDPRDAVTMTGEEEYLNEGEFE